MGVLEKIGGFDLPKRTAYLLAVALVMLYGVGALPELYTTTDYLDYNRHIHTVTEWAPEMILEQPATGHLRPAITKMSLYIFENPKTLAFGFSMALLFSVYLLGAQVSGKRLGGIISVLILSTSNFFKLFDTTAVYDNAWVFFYITSLYMIQKKWQFSIPLFMLAIYAKPLALLFLPVFLYWVYTSELSRKVRGLLCGTLGGIGIAFFVASQYLGYAVQSGFNLWGFVRGLHAWWWFLIADLYLTMAIPVMMIMLLALAGKKTAQSARLLAAIAMAAFSGAFLEGFAILYIANEPYRYIPLVALFAVSVPVIFRIRRRSSVTA